MPRLLLLTCHHWPNPALMAHALAAAGLEVGVLGPWWQPARLMQGLGFVASYNGRGKQAALRRAFAAFQPDLLVPCDDSAAALLHRLREVGADDAALLAGITRSVGGVGELPAVLHKSRFVARAAALGLAVPASVIVAAEREIPAALATVGLPCMVKRDESWGGAGVRLVRTEAEARHAWRDFATPPGWATTLRAALRQQDPGPLRDRLRFAPPGIALQALAPGVAVNRAVFCWRGEVLDGVTIEALEQLPGNGPSSVVRELAHPGIAAASACMVRALGLSGFIGFDFMLGASGAARLLELNPRVTPAATLLVQRPGFAARLAAALAGQALPPALPERTAAAPHVLFPQEIQRDPASAWLHRPEHRVPWSEPRLVAWCIAHALRRGREARRATPPGQRLIAADATTGEVNQPLQQRLGSV